MLAQTKINYSSGSASIKGEVMRTALILIKCKGPDALPYANRQAEVMQGRENGEEDADFWGKISKQIETLLNSD